jgi:DNA-binding NarL/FixJ family response regulator
VKGRARSGRGRTAPRTVAPDVASPDRKVLITVHDRARTRVLVVDDHRTFAELLSGALDREPDLVSVGHATTAAEALTSTLALRPEIVMMDVQLPDDDGFTATERIVESAPGTRVIILTAQSGSANVSRAQRAGACAFLLKDGALSTMLETVRTATVGTFVCDPALRDGGRTSSSRGPMDPVTPVLTQREQDVLALLADGCDVREIARRLGVTEVTCRGYVKSLLVKLDAHSQLQAVVAASRLGLLPWKAHV